MYIPTYASVPEHVVVLPDGCRSSHASTPSRCNHLRSVTLGWGFVFGPEHAAVQAAHFMLLNSYFFARFGGFICRPLHFGPIRR